jgi:CDP-glycerol:poly(glycerophosphate) glycerophosphotransferase
MRWVLAKFLALPLWVFVGLTYVIAFPIRALNFAARIAEFISRALTRVHQAMRKWACEILESRRSARKLAIDLSQFADEQHGSHPLDPKKKTVFLLITCGQAVRNFLLSDVLALLRSRFNVAILSPFAYSVDFRGQYAQPGVHVLPWFENFRSVTERFFLYYLMKTSGSRTHERWLENLEARAKTETVNRRRFLKHLQMRRASDFVGSLVKPRGMQALFHSYFLATLPRSLFHRLFSMYRPALVISTTAQHAEAWPLTYFARQHGCKTLANILSWDNTTTKPAMDSCCDYYTVWSEEMRREMAAHYSYIKTQVMVTGSPLFDRYYNRRDAMDRAPFLTNLGLPADRPYILWTTNTPSAMPDENEIIARFWRELQRTRLAGKISLLVRLHPKEDRALYAALESEPNVVVTVAGKPHWDSSDRWLPTEEDMQMLLNSMLHAAVSINVASTMSLESFALGLPTINVAFKSREDRKDQNLMWSFDMYHTSDHYRAIVDNGAVDLARSMEELVTFAIQALEHGNRRAAAMQRTLEQKAAYCDGTSARRFVDVVESILMPERISVGIPSRTALEISPIPHSTPAE